MEKETSRPTLPASGVSVVMPLYNKGGYVQRAIASVFEQTVAPLELIVVDDGSTDDGPDRVQKMRDPRITLIRQKNKGPGPARNAGLARVSGRYVAFLDADDEWLPTFLETALALLANEEANVTVVLTGFFMKPGTLSNADSIPGLQGGVFEVGPATDVALVRRLVTFGSVSCFAVMRTDAVRRLGGFFDRYRCLCGEDEDLLIRLIFHERIGVIPEPLGYYHTDASALWGGYRKSLPPLEPFLIEPKAMIEACPPEKRLLVARMLALRGLAAARTRALLGRGREARELLDRFNGKGFPDPRSVYEVRLLAAIAPILPAARWVRRWVKGARKSAPDFNAGSPGSGA